MSAEGDMRVFAAHCLERAEAELEQDEDLDPIMQRFLERSVMIHRMFLQDCKAADERRAAE